MNVIEGKQYIGELLASTVVKKYGTPLYVYDEEVIRFKYRELADSISYPKAKILYAVKANWNKRILEILKQEGAGVNVVSPGEIMAALNAGFLPSQMMYTPISASGEDLKFAISKKILTSVDSVSQLDLYGKLNRNSTVCLRINPTVGSVGKTITTGPHSKFGIWIGELEQAVATASSHGLKIIGLQQHIGSGILDANKFLNAVDIMLAAAKSFDHLEFVNFGGGLGVPYRADETKIDINYFGEKISEKSQNFSKNYGKELTVLLEPGSYLVAEAGALMCSVTSVKKTPKHTFVGVNTGFNHLVRPMAFGAYHPIVNINDAEPSKTSKVIITGNTSEANDVFTTSRTGIEDREMPLLKVGDVLGIMVTGAYGYTLSSNFNLIPRPAEILVSGRKMSVIRPEEKLRNLLQ